MLNLNKNRSPIRAPHKTNRGQGPSDQRSAVFYNRRAFGAAAPAGIQGAEPLVGFGAKPQHSGAA